MIVLKEIFVLALILRKATKLRGVWSNIQVLPMNSVRLCPECDMRRLKNRNHTY